MKQAQLEQRTKTVSVLPQEPQSQIGQNFVAAKTHLERCGYTDEILAIPFDVHQRVQRKDPSVRDKEFQGFYVSPEFFYYATRHDFNMFTED